MVDVVANHVGIDALISCICLFLFVFVSLSLSLSYSKLQKVVRSTAHHNIKCIREIRFLGPVDFDYSTIVPFNKDYHYHSCDPCPPGCSIQDWNNQFQVETCRLLMLPDLNQTVDEVANYLLKWIAQIVQYYEFDGIRVDTVPEVR
jgi:glycosidase